MEKNFGSRRKGYVRPVSPVSPRTFPRHYRTGALALHSKARHRYRLRSFRLSRILGSRDHHHFFLRQRCRCWSRASTQTYTGGRWVCGGREAAIYPPHRVGRLATPLGCLDAQYIMYVALTGPPYHIGRETQGHRGNRPSAASQTVHIRREAPGQQAR